MNHTCHLVGPGLDFLGNQMILVFVIDNDMRLLIRPTNIRSKHDIVNGFSVKLSRLEFFYLFLLFGVILTGSNGGNDFNITTTAIDTLFKLCRELYNKVFILVIELFIKWGRNCIEARILRRRQPV